MSKNDNQQLIDELQGYQDHCLHTEQHQVAALLGQAIEALATLYAATRREALLEAVEACEALPGDKSDPYYTMGCNECVDAIQKLIKEI